MATGRTNSIIMSGKEEQSKSITITSNGTTVINPDSGKTLSSVSIETNVPGTLKNLLDATKSCYYLFNHYDGTSVDDLIIYNDTSNVTNMDYMFAHCYNLTTLPQLDTSNVTTMTGGFYYCSSLTTIPQLDTSKVTNMQYMFYNCSNLTTIPQLDTSNVTDAINMYSMFDFCSSLEEIHMTGMKVSFNISASTKFTREALVEILNNLTTVTTTQTLAMGSTNLAKLTDEDKLIATNKGWTLV